jgi:hypothetical protein
MIVLSPRAPNDNCKRKIIKCPQCTNGRLCDITTISGIENKAVAVNENAEVVIVVKCPKCGTDIGITIK